MDTRKFFSYALLLLLLISIFSLGHFTPRTSFYQLIGLFLLAFGAYWGVLKNNPDLKIAITGAVLARVVLFGIEPNFSDDYFRFIWDGSLWTNGVNPFLYNPNQYTALPESINFPLKDSLFERMNSRQYYTVYPPVNQFIFALGAKVFPNSLLSNIMVMRAAVLLSEIGTIFFSLKLLKHFKLPAHNVLWYALNPLVIIEVTGNLHFEGIMLFFLVLSVWLLLRQKTFLSAIVYSFAVCTKLLPLMFLPFLFKRLGLVKTLIYCGTVGVAVLILFSPFLNLQLVLNLSTSLDLYFRTFEFNASIYYILRWLGFLTVGYNIIGYAGIWLSIFTLGSIIGLAIKKKEANWHKFFEMMLAAMTIFQLCATTIHPWYIVSLVLLSVFTRFRYAIVWSGMIVLSYFAYSNDQFQENGWLIALEYMVVGSVLVYEMGWLGRILPKAVNS